MLELHLQRTTDQLTVTLGEHSTTMYRSRTFLPFPSISTSYMKAFHNMIF
jgi:hypothetical protein